MFNTLICLLKGHNATVELTETDNAIYDIICDRCKTPLNLPRALKNVPPPPHSTKEQVKVWKTWYAGFLEETRDQIKSSEKKQMELVEE